MAEGEGARDGTIADDGVGSQYRPQSGSSQRDGKILSLRGRPTSATVGSRVSLSRDEGGPSGSTRDSVEDTRAFYGLRPLSPQSTSSRNPQVHRTTSQSTRGRDRSGSGRFSAHSRPTSPGSSSHPATSPIRNSIPLPLSRSFLTPKKPKAALKAEAEQRDRESRRSMSTVGHGDASSAGPLSPSTFSVPEDSREAEESEDEVELNERASSSSRTRGEPDLVDFLNLGPPEPANHRHSITTAASSNLRQIPTHPSAEGLVPPAPNKQVMNGNAAPHEKGIHGRRRYQSFENPLTTWFCGGRLMTGGDHVWSLVAAVVVLLGLTGVWMGTTGVWLWVNGTEYGLVRGGGIAIVIVLVYLFGIVSSSLLVSSFRDPGIIPRGLDPDPPMSQEGSWEQALDRTFVVKKGKVSVRYCETCGIYRPPRTSHCRLCGNCVDGIDHHCSYLHNCVGKRNYVTFLTLIITSAISSIYIVVFSALHFSLLCHHDHITFARALQESPGAAVSFLLGVAVLPGILFLLWYHCRLLLDNLTTIEQIRASASKNLWKARTRPDNPFASDSILSNILIASLGRPQFPSWVQAHKLDPPDRRLPNPALTDQKWWAWEKPL